MEQASKRTRLSEEILFLRDEHSQKLKVLEQTIMLRLVDHVADEKLLGSVIKEVGDIFHQANGSWSDEDEGSELERTQLIEQEVTVLENPRYESWLIKLPVHSALSNHLILTEIFKYLPFKDLKSCREVCPGWNEIAMNILKARDCCQVTLWDMADAENCQLGSRYSTMTIENLIFRMEEPNSFPFTNFEIHSESLSKSIPFFDNHGHCILSLSIVGIETVVNLGFILRKCTSMKSLKLDLTDFSNETSVEGFFKLFPDQNVNGRHCQVFLPNLLYLEFVPPEEPWMNQDTEVRILRALILASPNLVELKNFNSNMFEAVFLSNKVNLVKSVHFKPSKDNLEMFLAFASQGPALRQLTFECMRMNPKKTETMRKLLQSSNNSLVTLKTDPLGILGTERLQGPFENLESLTLHHRNVSSSLLPGGAGFSSQMFPKLRLVRFEIRVKRPSINSLFAFQRGNSGFQNEGVPSVETVQIMNDMDRHGLYLIVTKFPNITKLTLKETYFPVKATDNRIWELLPTNLQTLEIFDSTFQFHIEEKNFDCLFTGIPMAVCKDLGRGAAIGTDSNVVKRTKSWIGQLENLKKLRFAFHQEESYVNHGDWTLSHVTAALAFSLMPGLQVVIGYDQMHRLKTALEQKLEPLAPFVIFQNDPNAA